MEAYRSGHNEPDSKSGCPHGHVSSNLTASAMSLFAVNVRRQALPFLVFSTLSFEGVSSGFVETDAPNPLTYKALGIFMKQSVENHSLGSSPLGSTTRFLSNIPSITSPDSICA